MLIPVTTTIVAACSLLTMGRPGVLHDTGVLSTTSFSTTTTNNTSDRAVTPSSLAALRASSDSFRAASGVSASRFAPAPLQESAPFDLSWALRAPAQVLSFDYEPGLTSQQNGEALRNRIRSLQPGQRLEIGSGVYSIANRFDLSVVASDTSPIWIVAKPGHTPVITRPDAGQNTINLGSGGPLRYVVLQGLEIRGGDTAVKIYDAQNLWIDGCHIHHCGGSGISANTNDASALYLTRNEIHDTAGTAEGMYLGANNGASVVSFSLIAENHIHDTRGSQGDGIELKQGSYGNWIVGNLVHDCQFPCILVYGTNGRPLNIVERNTCYNSGDNVMQVQGEAIVYNNLIMNGSTGFHSHDHQGQTRNLLVLHNTIINAGRATDMSSWNGRVGMFFINNVVYSLNGESISFPNGSSGVTVTGNVVLGRTVGRSTGYVTGRGLTDFIGVSWNAAQRNARPSATGAIIGTGNPVYGVGIEITGARRQLPLEAGCYDGQ